jgi:hypothetical protein
MNQRDHLLSALQRNHWIIGQQTRGLTHAESLLQLPFRGNCFNWVLGHVLLHRDKMAAALGLPAELSSAEGDPYRADSEPLTDGASAVPLARLLEAVDVTQSRLVAAFEGDPQLDLDAIYDEERGRTVLDRIVFLVWHETYHLGQLEILRQLAGKDDAII